MRVSATPLAEYTSLIGDTFKSLCMFCGEPISRFHDKVTKRKLWIHDISHKRGCDN